MGVWSRDVGEAFLRWLAPAPGWRWADVGCGNGAFTELLLQRCAPAEVKGVDPAAAQIAFARDRFPNEAPVAFEVGDAQALPWAEAAFDAATMALVIFFVPDPAKSVAEMVRVTRPGGSVSTYAWDLLGGGFPYAAMFEAMRRSGSPRRVRRAGGFAPGDLARALAGRRTGRPGDRDLRGAARVRELRSLLGHRPHRTRVATTIAGLSDPDRARLREALRRRVPADGTGRVVRTARANAIKGRVANR